MRITLAVAVACLSVCGLAAAGDATAAIRKQVDIPAEGLGPALNALAKDRDFQIVYVTEEIASVRTDGAVGEFTTEEALKKLLTGTGLTYRYLDDKTITITSATTPRQRGDTSSKTTSSGSSDDVNSDKEGKKSPSGSFRVAQVDQGKNTSASSIAERDSTTHENSNLPSTGLAEILVTAQKREERLQDVPVAVTALSADSLRSQNQLRLQDYFLQVPGLSMSISNQSVFQNIAIRGITTGAFGVPTVALTIDDVPLAGAQSAPDLDPSDLAQIEVLRGPQGTLYGASALGGLIKYATVDPSTSGLTGSVQAGASSIAHGGNAGYNFRAAVNVPLGETFAIRLSGFTHEEPGWIDNPVYGDNGVNKQNVVGGHLTALWAPTDWASLKFNALYQHEKLDGPRYTETGVVSGIELSQLQNGDLPGWDGFDRKLQFYSANLRLNFGKVEFTSVTGYSSTKFLSSLDLSSLVEGFFYGNPFPVHGFPLTYPGKTNKFSEEMRLTGSLGPKLDWLVGAFYTDENSPLSGNGYNILAEDTSTFGVVGRAAYGLTETKNKEYSGFADLTVHVSDRFDVQIGGREAHITQSQVNLTGGSSIGPQVTTTALSGANANAFTYLFTPRFKFSEDFMAYIRLASGYRPGGGNGKAAYGDPVPSQYNPDKTKNYEVGVKTELLDHRLRVDSALYYIDWKGVQLFLQNNQNFAYIGNTAAAKSQGVELSVDVRPLTGLSFVFNGSYSDSVLTRDIPVTATVFGLDGDRLPHTSRFTGSVSAQQDIVLSREATAFIGGALSYVGNRQGEFQSAGVTRADLPGYARLDLRTGVNYNAWTANLFANNLTDRRGLLETGFVPANGQFFIQPRTVGLNVSRTF